MAEETQDPAGVETGPEEEAPRPASRRARPAPPARPVDPPRGWGQPYLLTMGVSAIVLVFALAFFMAGFFTHAAVDDDGGGTPVVANPTAPAAQTPVVAQPTSTPPVVVEDVSVDDDPSVGPADAPVTIVEFSDYQ